MFENKSCNFTWKVLFPRGGQRGFADRARTSFPKTTPMKRGWRGHQDLLTNRKLRTNERSVTMVTTTNDFLLHDAIMYNTKAVSQMQAGDYEGAFNLLCTSMTNLSSARQAAMKLASPEYTSTPSTSIVVTSSPIDTTNDRFYSGSLLFSLPGNDMFLLPSLRQIDYCTTICLFNMALACHLEYETCQVARKRDLHLSQARTLYSTAYEILQKYKIETTDAVAVVVMALCANLIDIETEFGNLEHVRFWSCILVDACNTANPRYFRGSAVYSFFDITYVPPGELIAARAA